MILIKLVSLGDSQFAVMRKYACVECRFFGFNIWSHFWECEERVFASGLARSACLCSKFVCNMKLRAGVNVGSGSSG